MSNLSNRQNPKLTTTNNPSSLPPLGLQFNNLNQSGMSQYAQMSKKTQSCQDPGTSFANKGGGIVYGKNCSFFSSTPLPNYDDSFDSISTGYSSECGSSSAFVPIQTPQQYPTDVPRFNHGKRNAAPPVPQPRISKPQNKIELQALKELQMFENEAFIKEKQQSFIQNSEMDSANSSCESSTFLNLSKTNIGSTDDTPLSNVSKNIKTETPLNSTEEDEKNLNYTDLKTGITSQHVAPIPQWNQNNTAPQKGKYDSGGERPMDYFEPLRYLWAMSDEPNVLRKEAERALVYFDPVQLEPLNDKPAQPENVVSWDPNSASTATNPLPNLLEGQPTMQETNENKSSKVKSSKKKQSQKLISFESESEEEIEDEKEGRNETTEEKPTEAETDSAEKQTEECENTKTTGASGTSDAEEGKKIENFKPHDLPEDIGDCLEPGDETYDEYDENREKKVDNSQSALPGQSGINPVQSQKRTTNSSFMQPLPNGYVPLDDLWEQPWFDMKATSLVAGKQTEFFTVLFPNS